MRPAKAVLSPIALTLFVLLAARLAPGGMQVTHKGCDLPFQAGVSFVVTDGGGYATIDMTKWNDAALIQDSNGCVDPLLDYPNAFNPNPNATACNVVPKSLGHVKIYSKRDDGGKFMYLLFDVDDQTIPTNQVLTALGDRIIIQLDTKPSGAKSLTPATFRLDYVVPRGSPGTGSRLWYKGSTTNQTATWTQGTPPAALAIAGGDRPDASGYRVAFQIPLADATVGYDLAANNQFPDFGIAIAIVNDIGCFDPNSDPQNPGVTYEMLTGAAFPGGIADAQNPNSLTISNFTDPMLTDLSSITPEPNASPEDNWFNPSLWATGTFKGAGDSVYITHDSNFYTSDDIKTTYCNVANFADVIGPGQKNSNWYQYFAGAPAPGDVRPVPGPYGGRPADPAPRHLLLGGERHEHSPVEFRPPDGPDHAQRRRADGADASVPMDQRTLGPEGAPVRPRADPAREPHRRRLERGLPARPDLDPGLRGPERDRPGRPEECLQHHRCSDGPDEHRVVRYGRTMPPGRVLPAVFGHREPRR